MVTYIGDIVEEVPVISLTTKNEKVDRLFKKNSKLQGIVVLDNQKPIGLVTRAQFYQRIGTLYGYNLYMGRAIELMTNKHPLIVEYSQSISEVSKLAMNRREEELYDYVVVTQNGKYVGVVSIRNLLIKFSEIQVKMASVSNPLTGLPGNSIIEEQLQAALSKETFSVLYIDLDNFKAFNDTYGFKSGDKMLLETATLLKTIAATAPEHFLGHIGGDDFIMVTNTYDVEPICKMMIKSFDSLKKSYYNEEDLLNQYVTTENRAGQLAKIPLVSLSIAIVTNERKSFKTVEEIIEDATKAKKLCKAKQGSCYIINSCFNI